MSFPLVVIAVGVACLASAPSVMAGTANSQCVPSWQSTFGPSQQLGGSVNALVDFDDGAGGGAALYAGGSFGVAGPVTVHNIARWNGTSWSALGGGLAGGVNALVTFDDGSGPALYAGGSFFNGFGDPTNFIARWNGVSWTPLGSGLNNSVFALLVFDDGSGRALYAAGNFTQAGGEPAKCVAKWNGTRWSPLGAGLDNTVVCLAAFDDGSGQGTALYAGGTFTTTGGRPAAHLARWSGANWSAVGDGTDGNVNSLHSFDDGTGNGPSLYAVGSFTHAGAVSAHHVARWNGALWSPLGVGTDQQVFAATSYDDGTGGGEKLYVGGPFAFAGATPAAGIAEWNGTTWSPVGAGVSGGAAAVNVLKAFQRGAASALFVGGNYSSSPGGDAYLARWQGCPAGNSADLNGDGFVNAADLGILLGAWGSPGIGDINDDGTTDAGDLAILLGAWTS